MCTFKQFKWIDKRYDRYINNYLNFMYLGAIKIIMKKNLFSCVIIIHIFILKMHLVNKYFLVYVTINF